MSILITRGLYFGGDMVMVCDRRCDKAWGINNRPRVYLDDPEQVVYPNKVFHYPEQDVIVDCADWDMDNYAYLSDKELKKAPKYPGTWEGGDGKPLTPPDVHNKWCCRECERCEMIFLKDLPHGQAEQVRDFSKRVYNKKQEGKMP